MFLILRIIPNLKGLILPFTGQHVLLQNAKNPGGGSVVQVIKIKQPKQGLTVYNIICCVSFQDIGVLCTYSIVVVLMVICVITTVIATSEAPAKMDHDPICT